MGFNFKELISIRIKNLLFQNEYILDFSKKDNPLIILHGENGSGKTTLLNIIFDLLNGGYQRVLNYEFTIIEFIFENECIIKFFKNITDNKIVFTNEIVINGKNKIQNNKLVVTDKIEINSISDLRQYLRKSPSWISIDNDDNFPFYNKSTDEILNPVRNSSELHNIILHHNLGSQLMFEKSISNYLKSLNAHFINTDRLVILPRGIKFDPEIKISRKIKRRFVGRNDQGKIDPLRYIQSHLRSQIEIATENSSSLGRKFDSEFFDLLLDQVKEENIQSDVNSTRKIFNDQLEEIDSEESDLVRLGLYDISETTETERAKKILKEDDETISKMFPAMVIFNKGLKEKFSQFDELKKNVSLFTGFLEYHLRGKKLIVSRSKGFEFKNSIGNIMQPRRLSSGEKHIIVLAYNLIFLVKENSLILIDEPEISLHLSWQRAFLNNILQITKDKGINFIVATHSPAISTPFEKSMLKLNVGGSD